MTRRRAGLAAASVVAAVLVAAGVAPAAADDDALSTTWDGPTVHLRADGGAYSTSTTSFLGALVAVPGDVVGRTLTVRNDGPGDAVLRGWVTDVRLLDPEAADVDPDTGLHQGDFYSDLTLTWRTASGDGAASFRALAAVGRTPLVEVPLAQGETTGVTLVSAFPAAATSGNGADVDARDARFSVLLELAGRPAALRPTPSPTVGGPAADEQGTGSTAPPAGDVTRAGVALATAPLATTGAEALRPALVGVTAVGVGGLLLAAVRRRRGERPERH